MILVAGSPFSSLIHSSQGQVFLSRVSRLQTLVVDKYDDIEVCGSENKISDVLCCKTKRDGMRHGQVANVILFEKMQNTKKYDAGDDK